MTCKRHLVLLLLLMPMHLLFPGMMPHRLQVLSMNDLFTYGITSNADDLRTFGTYFSMEYDAGWFAVLQMSALTDRYSSEDGGRIDELIGSTGLRFPVLQLPYLTLHAYVSAGAAAAGNLGTWYIQQQLHALLHLTDISLDYQGDSTASVFPFFSAGCTAETSYPLPGHPDSSAVLRLSGRGSYAPGYQHGWEGSLTGGITSGESFYMTAGAGYTRRYSTSRYPVHDLVARFETGWDALFSMKIGILSVKGRWNLSNLHGSSGIGIEYSRHAADAPQGRDLTVTHSAAFPYPGLSTSLRYEMLPNLGITARNTFFSFISDGARPERQNLSIWLAGADYEFDAPFVPDFLIPFTAFEAGIRRLLAVEYTGGTEHFEILMSHTRFCAELTAGVRLLQNGEIFWNGASFGIEAAGGIQFNDISHLPEESQGIALYRPNQWYPVLRIGLTASTAL